MNSKSYIDQLAKEWNPSAKKPEPWYYLFLFGLSIVFLILELTFKSLQLHPLRMDFIIPYILFGLGIYSIFRLSSPGENLSWILGISLTLIGIRTFYMIWNIHWIEFADPGFYTMKHAFCPSHFAIYALPLLFVFYFIFRSKFTTQTKYAALIGIITSLSIAEVILNAFCPDIRFSHLSFWHFLSWGIPITIGLLFYRRRLDW